MTRFFNTACAARIACLALAGVAVFAAWTVDGRCALWVSVGFFSLWHIGEALLALSAALSAALAAPMSG